MDAAEAWLQEHDPRYRTSRAAWKDLTEDGEYESPRREIPVGDARDVEAIALSRGLGLDIYEMHERHCLECGRTFMPYKRDHWYCSDTHAARVRKRRSRNAKSAP